MCDTYNLGWMLNLKNLGKPESQASHIMNLITVWQMSKSKRTGIMLYHLEHLVIYSMWLLEIPKGCLIKNLLLVAHCCMEPVISKERL